MASSSSSSLPQRFHPLFDALKIPCSKYPYSSIAAARHALSPLTVPPTEFCFERTQYIALGDAIIHRAISKEVCGFFLRRSNNNLANFTATHNTVQHICACFHNALSVRLVAESLPFAAVASDEESNSSKISTGGTIMDIFAAARTPKRGPMANRDRLGTSFEWHPHRFAQCDLSPRLSHFFGCLHLFCSANGEEGVALEAARRAFFNLDSEHGSNVPFEAAKLLATLCDRYAPANVVQAVLAAQGLRVDFISRSVGGAAATVAAAMPADKGRKPPQAPPAADGRAESTAAEGKSLTKGTGGAASAAAAESGIVRANNHEQQTSDGIATKSPVAAVPAAAPKIPSTSHALGPGRVNLISKWHRAVGSETASATTTAVATTTAAAAASEIGSGWTTPDAEASSFFSSSTSSSSAAASSSSSSGFAPTRFRMSIADLNGVPPISDLTQSKYVSKRHQNTPVKDPGFFDKADAAAGKDGVPLTNSPVVFSSLQSQGKNGLSTSVAAQESPQQQRLAGGAAPTTRDIVDALSQPHTRLFEVVIVRDPLVFSSKLRKEIYSEDAAAADIGQGRSISDMTRERMFRFGGVSSTTAAAAAGRDNNAAAAFGDEDEAGKTPSVGARVVARGMGTSYGEARTAAAINYLEMAVADLASF